MNTATTVPCQGGQHYGYPLSINGGPPHCSNCGQAYPVPDPLIDSPLLARLAALEARLAAIEAQLGGTHTNAPPE